jgi:hypothetical protein
MPLQALSSVCLVDSVDERSLPLCSKAGGKLKTFALYKLCTFDEVLDEH